MTTPHTRDWESGMPLEALVSHCYELWLTAGGINDCVRDGSIDRAIALHEEMKSDLLAIAALMDELKVSLQLERVLSYSLEGDGDV